MDSHVWRLVYATVRSVDRSVPREGRSKRYSDVLIVGMYLWSVWHDRPLCWACDRCHYGSLFRPRRLPSVSQFCKRMQSERCQRVLERVYERLARKDKIAVRQAAFMKNRLFLISIGNTVFNKMNLMRQCSHRTLGTVRIKGFIAAHGNFPGHIFNER